MFEEVKRALTTQERIKAAYLHCVRGLMQHDIATAFEVNHGRVNEAIQAIVYAAQHPKAILELIAEEKK
jgi:predicted XRE-type DNA-binding protein